MSLFPRAHMLSVLIQIFCLRIACGQEYTSESSIDTSFADIVSIDATYGAMLYRNPVHSNLNSIAHFKVGAPIETIGLALNVTYVRNDERIYGMRLAYAVITPLELPLISDSINARVSGGHFSCLVPGMDLTPESRFSSVLLGWGFNAGRMTVRSDEYQSQKNPYFAPAILLNPKFFIRHLSLTFCVGYQFDISRRKWKDVLFAPDREQYDLPDFRQSGLNLSFGLGWKF